MDNVVYFISSPNNIWSNPDNSRPFRRSSPVRSKQCLSTTMNHNSKQPIDEEPDYTTCILDFTSLWSSYYPVNTSIFSLFTGIHVGLCLSVLWDETNKYRVKKSSTVVRFSLLSSSVQFIPNQLDGLSVRRQCSSSLIRRFNHCLLRTLRGSSLWVFIF